MSGGIGMKASFVLRIVALGISVSWVLFLSIPASGLMHELGFFTLGGQVLGGIMD